MLQTLSYLWPLKLRWDGSNLFLMRNSTPLPCNSYWSKFLRSMYNKTQLISFLTAHLRQHFSQQRLEDRMWLILASGHSNAVCVKSEGEIERLALKISQNEADISKIDATHGICHRSSWQMYMHCPYSLSEHKILMLLSFLCIILYISTWRFGLGLD